MGAINTPLGLPVFFVISYEVLLGEFRVDEYGLEARHMRLCVVLVAETSDRVLQQYRDAELIARTFAQPALSILFRRS